MSVRCWLENFEVVAGMWWSNACQEEGDSPAGVIKFLAVRGIFRKWERDVGTGWSWLRIGTGGGRLWVR